MVSIIGKANVCVVCAGFAGLAAGVELLDRGHDITVSKLLTASADGLVYDT